MTCRLYRNKHQSTVLGSQYSYSYSYSSTSQYSYSYSYSSHHKVWYSDQYSYSPKSEYSILVTRLDIGTRYSILGCPVLGYNTTAHSMPDCMSLWQYHHILFQIPISVILTEYHPMPSIDISFIDLHDISFIDLKYNRLLDYSLFTTVTWKHMIVRDIHVTVQHS